MLEFENAFSLKNKIAIVTGGATGLGLAMTKCFIKAGAKVIVASSSPKEKYEDVLSELGDNIDYRQYDVKNTENAQKFVYDIIEKYGKIDILVNNAGVHCKKPIEEMEVSDFENVIDVHLVGAFALTKAVIPEMRKQKSGNIIFIASMTSYIGQPYVVGYATAKSGVLGMIRDIAAEVGLDGIRVNGIAPGWIDTPMLHKAVDNDLERKQKIIGRTPMKKFGEPEDIGWAAVYLCSDAAKFVTGTVLPIDGGAVSGF